MKNKFVVLLSLMLLIFCVPLMVGAEKSELGKIEFTNNTTTVDGDIRYSGQINYFEDDRYSIYGAYFDGVENSFIDRSQTIPDKGNAFLYVGVDSKEILPCQNVYITVEYYDHTCGWFYISYINNDGNKTDTEIVSLPCGRDFDGPKSYTFTISDMRFGALENGHDFFLSTYKSSNSYEYSREAVVVKSVSVSTDGTYAPIKIESIQKNIGNIFFGNSAAEMELVYTNVSDTAVRFSAQYNIYRYNEDMTKELIHSESDSHYIKAGKQYKALKVFNVDKYGLYEMVVILSGEAGEKTICSEKSYKFSKAVLSENLNDNFGAAGYVRSNTDISVKSFEIMKKAGMGIVRGGLYEAGLDADMYEYDAARDMGIERINTIIYREIPSLDSDSLSKIYSDMYNYISSETVTKSVDMIGITNEPETYRYIDGVDISGSPDRFEIIGERYALISAVIAKAVKDANPEVKVGLFEINFLKEEIPVIVDKALEIYAKINEYDELAMFGEFDINDLFDAFICHPYMGFDDAEKGNLGELTDGYFSINEKIQYYKDLFSGKEDGVISGNKYSVNIPEVWCTEMGWSTSTMPGGMRKSDEFDHAKNIVRQYLCLNEFDTNGKYCFYQLMDLNSVSAECECSFGFIRSGDSPTPYSAKYAFIAAAALNNFIADAEEFEVLYDEDFSYIHKFDKTDNEVYVLWTSSPHEKEIPFDKYEDAVFYDMLGNKIEPKINDGNVIVSDAPIYAVRGYERKMAYISGYSRSCEEGEVVSMVVLKPGVDFGGDMYDGIIHIDEGKTDKDGKYEFKPIFTDIHTGLNAYVILENEDNPIRFSFGNLKDDVQIVMRNTVPMLNGVDVSFADVDIRFTDMEAKEYILYYAAYDDERLVAAGKMDFDTQAGEYVFSHKINLAYDEGYDTIKIMLFDKDKDMVPLCDALAVQ